MPKRDIFQSVPAEGAVIRNWTHSTLTVDIENAIGEKYHFEIEPGEDPSKLPTRNTASPSDKSYNNINSVSVVAIICEGDIAQPVMV